ncbi:MAG: hypothetical protein HQL37_07680 [Alphaproteobacteria bacterium]|nr:hypothetical protein [Alphaproteobacteria bacterium]
MTAKTRDKTLPALSEAGRAEAEARFDRRAAALRENLKKRKAQQLGRDQVKGHRAP